MIKKKVYLINQVGTTLYKIGITKKQIQERIKELQTGNANELVPVSFFQTSFGNKLETHLHAHYRTKRINSEWFDLTESEVADFISACEKYESTIKMLKESGNPFI